MGKSFRALIILAICAASPVRADDEAADYPPVALVVSVADQKLALLKDGGLSKRYPISTSKFGLGDSFNSYKTPLGRLRVCDKIGDNLAMGAVLKSRNATGEILPVNAPGRDPIVTRILWLEGLESHNANAKSRGIYIHGTVEENRIGEPVSYGCIRMRSRDVVELFEEVPVGTPVLIITEKLPRFRKATPKPETLIAANESVTMKTVGPHGQVTVRTSRRVAFAPSEKEEPVAAPKPPELPRLTVAKAPLVAKKAAEAAPIAPAATPAPEVPEAEEGPRVVFAQLPRENPRPAAAPEPTIVFKLKESILTVGVTSKPQPPAPARVVEEAPVAPKWVTLAVAAPVDFLSANAERPLDLLSAALMEEPDASVRVAFRTASLPAKL